VASSRPDPRNSDWDNVDYWNDRIKTVVGGSIPIKFEKVSLEEVILSLDVDSRSHQPRGILHGGISVLLAETAASVAAHRNSTPDKSIVGLEINANHIRSVSKGIVYAKATAIHVGRSTQIWSIRISDTQDRTVCLSRCTIAVLNKNPDDIEEDIPEKYKVKK
tara:strand:+ start:202 stop:690 length:489 start_codon:yes stop_codon:yes gene_type:complete